MKHIKPLALATVAFAALWMGATPEGRARDNGSPQDQQRPQEQKQPQSSDPQSFRFRTGVELINVTATVSDDSGRFVSGLHQDDFTV